MKFLNLLKKELRELLTKQLILGVIVTMSMLFIVGQVMGGVVNDAISDLGKINIIDSDDTDFTRDILDALSGMGYTVNKLDASLAELSEPDIIKEAGVSNVNIIPEGFTNSIINDKKPSSIIFIENLRDTSIAAQIGSSGANIGGTIGDMMKNMLLAGEYGLSEEDIAMIDAPVTVNEYTVVGDKSANVASSVISNLMSNQGMIIPIVIFILIMMVSQMIISAVSNEKIDKTLETLLSAPVSRLSVLSSKMLAATIVAIIYAVAYMFGFNALMTSIIDGAAGDITTVIGEALSTSEIMSRLGLQLGLAGYLLMGVQMFFTIMIVLSVSIILGAMVNDIKSAQTAIMPIMFIAMVPYLISMIMDVNSLSLVFRLVIYAIPFTHTFNAVNNIMFGNWNVYLIGLAYQIVFFIVCMFFALKLFTSDKIFTISLNLGQKKKFQQSKGV